MHIESMVSFPGTCVGCRVTSILLPYRNIYVIQTTTNKTYRVERKEAECKESDTESTDATDLNKATVAQDADDTSHASYVNVNPTQLHYVDDDTRLSNVYVESGMEATDPTDLNKTTISQDADNISQASYVNVNPTQLHGDTCLSNESGAEATDPAYVNVNATATQRATTTTRASYVGMNPTQLCTTISKVDYAHSSNVCVESGTEATDSTDLNKATVAQEADDTSDASYVNVNPTQMHYLDDDTHSSNVSIESGSETTDPTYMNINATVAQGAATTTHTSYVNIAQFSEMKKKM